MRYIDEFRNKNLVRELSRRIKKTAPKYKINIMEVCGTHTQSFYRFGLDKLLPATLRLIAGPGCPVCVSSQGYIDTAIKLAQQKDVIIVTFGDMLRIPGSSSSLEKERARFGNVRLVYSALESLEVARANPDKKIIFLAVGFETTAPTIALSIAAAGKGNFKNLFFFSSLKLIPPAMAYLIRDKRLNLSGFLCPGHVSAIIGARPYELIARRSGVPCCIAGFEPLDILEGIYLLLLRIIRKKSGVANQYIRVVKRQGNGKALGIIKKFFEVSDACWRGIGTIPDSGFKIRSDFSQFDAEKVFSISDKQLAISPMHKRCRCGDVLKGLISPLGCPLFSKGLCRPDNPVGPCMVSFEGACNAYYKYKK